MLQKKKGGYAVRKTVRRGSAVPTDQALEQYYNKPATAAGEIIGFTRRKESVTIMEPY